MEKDNRKEEENETNRMKEQQGKEKHEDSNNDDARVKWNQQAHGRNRCDTDATYM